MSATENDNIAWRVAELLRTHGIVIDEKHRGPVPLSRVFDECELLHAALPDLNRRAIQEHLMDQGIAVGDIGPAGDLLSGFIITVGRVGWAYVNASDILPRRRFTAAHELGHFILHREQMVTGYLSDTSSNILETIDDDALQAMEREANQFAVELLMPAVICRTRAEEMQKSQGCCPRVVLTYQLAAELLVSREAMRYRLLALEVGNA